MWFEWDKNKAKSNVKKHHVTFIQAKGVFKDDNRSTKEDTRKDYGEDRFNTVGDCTPKVRDTTEILNVTHTPRNGGIRIISARSASTVEKSNYEKGLNSSCSAY